MIDFAGVLPHKGPEIRVGNTPERLFTRGTLKADVARSIDALLDLPESRQLVSRYYDEKGTFAGRLFDQLGQNSPNVFTRDDLLAVTLLDVRFTPTGIRSILGSEADVLAEELSRLPPNLALWDADDAQLDCAEPLWRRLVATPGVGEVIAGKLLARKRPRLIPIVDQVVIRVLGPAPENYWRGIRGALQDTARRERIEALRSNDSKGISQLRLLDSLVWMHGSESRSARAARVQVGLTVQPRQLRARDPRG